jgi:uncharacterized membrane protein
MSAGAALIPLGVSIHVIARAAPGVLAVFDASILAVGVNELLSLALIRAGVVRSFVSIAPVVAWLASWAMWADHRAALVLVSSIVAVLESVNLPALGDLKTIGVPEIVSGGDAILDAIFLNYVLSLFFAGTHDSNKRSE